MSRILLAWELGGNLGHITRLLMVAKVLRERGHDVSFALRDVRAAGDMLTRESFPFIQAPSPRSVGPREPASYPEILLHYGFADSAPLVSAVRAWRQIYRNQAPDLIVFDHAPTALLAARGTGIPRVVLGTGFVLPPRVSPMPSIRPWQHIPMERLETSEQRALHTANAALRTVDARPMDVFHELLDVETNILATLPELDHYGARPYAQYSGAAFDHAGGAKPRWPKGSGRKLFVYIRPTSPGFRVLATTLPNTNFRTLWFAPGLPICEAAKLKSPTLRIVHSPIDLRSVIRSADAAVLHGGHGTTAAMLLGGVPVLLLPEHVEQLLMGTKVAMLGAGAALNVNLLPPNELSSAALRLLDDPRFALHAKAFASKYKCLSSSSQLRHVSMRLEELLALNGRNGQSDRRPVAIEDQSDDSVEPTSHAVERLTMKCDGL